MIKYIDKLYTTEKTAKKTDDYIFSLYSDKLINSVYVIALALCENDVFDILSAKAVKEIDSKDIDIVILGIAENKSACEQLCEDMIIEYMQSKASIRNISMREYFENKLFDK